MSVHVVRTPVSWEKVVEIKRKVRARLIDKHLSECSLPKETVEAITDISDVRELARKISDGVFTAEQVTRAYIQSAAEVHLKTNCLTEINFSAAVERACHLDTVYKTGSRLTPLHGVPVTFKDQFNIRGLDTTLGYVGRANKPATADAAIVQILEQLGCVVLAKTNLPQSIMWAETENPLWGLTVNPRNAEFSPGGSTGGEGALLASNASILGWGTDIGGSVRIPAAINGLYGLRPSSGRLPYLGTPVSTEGQEHVHSVIGPMARSLATVTDITKLIINAKPWRLDPRCHPIPWRQDIYEATLRRPLVIGIVHDDGVVRPHPPLACALRDLEARLRAAGHQIVAWDTSDHMELIEIMDLYYTADGGEDIRRDVEAGGEPYIPHVEALVNRGSAISVYEYWQLNRRKLAAQVAYNDKWEASNVDVLLTPTLPHTAHPHKRTKWIGYTKVWNVLDYTALAFPAGVSAGQEKPEYIPRNDLDQWNWEEYDASSMNGHPVGLQIIGRRLEEEKVLGVATVFQSLMKSQKKVGIEH